MASVPAKTSSPAPAKTSTPAPSDSKGGSGTGWSAYPQSLVSSKVATSAYIFSQTPACEEWGKSGGAPAIDKNQVKKMIAAFNDLPALQLGGVDWGIGVGSRRYHSIGSTAEVLQLKDGNAHIVVAKGTQTVLVVVADSRSGILLQNTNLAVTGMIADLKKRGF